LKVSLVWSAPKPEKTIAVAMRRCYSAKPIEEIEVELEQKGPEYWKFLLSRALQDKSLDVMEHFAMTLLAEGLEEDEVAVLARGFPFIHFLRLNEGEWLVSMNARTLIELWRSRASVDFAKSIVAELDSKGVCPMFNSLVFGESARAS
jgi:hypothetical protein